MTGIEHGMVIGALMLLLMALRLHIAMAMMLAGSIGYIWMTGSAPLLNYMKTAAWARYSIYDLSAARAATSAGCPTGATRWARPTTPTPTAG